MTKLSIVWFRQDLRLADQAAVAAASTRGPWIGVYVLDDGCAGEWSMGAAQRWWLHHSLASLSGAIRTLGGRLILRRGRTCEELVRIAEITGADEVHALWHYEPWWQEAEAAVGAQLHLRLHDGGRLAPPDAVLTGARGRYRMFTPYWRALKDLMPPPRPLPAPDRIEASAENVPSDELAAWGLLPVAPDWSAGFAAWQPGEAGAQAALEHFLPLVGGYGHNRDRPSIDGTSNLSAHLHFGEISPATLWHRATGAARSEAEPWLRQLGWRDFCANIIDILPHYGEVNGRPGFDSFRWRAGEAADQDFRAWTRGRTGYPIVDAGMRQLWATGFMHNRVRMIVASFLTKHLLIEWQRGERWFWDTLIDADYPSNSVNWQWVAGTGIDSNPFGRIMAPLVQSPKFDAGPYIRCWVPELAGLDDDAIHDPAGAGLQVRGYPEPLIGHRAARERALAASAQI